MEFNIKIWKNFRNKKRLLIIREDDFQIKKIVDDKKKKKKNENIKTYSLIDALILDQTKKNDLEIFIASKDYKLTIIPANFEDKAKIINTIEKIIKKFTFQNVFKDYNLKMSQYNDKENEISPQDFLTARLFLFKNLMNEVILTYTNNYFVITEKDRKGSLRRINTILSAMSKDEKNELKEIEFSSDDDQNIKNLNIENIKEEENNIIENINIIDNKDNNIDKTDNSNNINNTNFNFKYNFLSFNKEDFQNNLYNFPKRNKYTKTLKYPKNIVKEMISAATQNKPAPVYFNEPLSICQKQCEKFFYLDLLKKVYDIFVLLL